METTVDEANYATCCRRKIAKETLLLVMTISGVAVGVILGVTINTAEPSEDIITLIAFPGEVFMRALKMLVIPILFTSVVVGLSKLDYHKSGNIWLHCFSYYVTTTIIAVVLGILLVSAIRPGMAENTIDNKSKGIQRSVPSTMDSLLDIVRNLFPDNIIAACFRVSQTKITKKFLPIENNSTLTNDNITNITAKMVVKKSVNNVEGTNILGLMVFAILFGVTMSSYGDKTKILADFMEGLNDIFMRMIIGILWLSPIGICFLIAGIILKIKNIGLILTQLGLYMVTVITGLVIHFSVILPLIYFAITRKNPYNYIRNIIPALLTGFGISSSAGTLPITMKCLENNLGIDERVTRFVLPVGATMNMDGTALMEGVAAITIAQMYGMDLNLGQIVSISITTTLTSIGAASIPSSGLVALLIVLNAIGVPSEPVGLLWSIDWFLDRLRTVVNITGDSIGAGLVAHLNRELLNKCKSEKSNGHNGIIALEEMEQLATVEYQ